MDISEAQIVASNKIKITYIIKNFVTKYGFEPKNGETWVDAIEMTHEKIRVLLRERADGGKILIKDGFRYVPVNDNNESFQKDVVPKIWKRTKISTNAFEKCFN